jgi:hypothetical protein
MEYKSVSVRYCQINDAAIVSDKDFFEPANPPFGATSDYDTKGTNTGNSQMSIMSIP